MSLDDDIEQPSTENPKLNPDEIGSLANKLVNQREVVKGRSGQLYKIIQKLGRGSFGSVFLVESLQDSKFKAALKIVQSQTVIEIEESILKKAYERNSERLCRLLDSGCTEDGMEFVVMDLLGPDLSTYITTGTSLKIKFKISEQCLIAVEALHSLGFLHRDLKPNNFVLGRKGSDKEFIVILIDFGMAESIKGDNKSSTGTEIYGSIAGWEERSQGPKDDLESWFYMLIEWIRGLPWTSDENEDDHLEMKKAIRDDKTETCKEFFGDFDPKSLKKDDFYVDFAKIMRYIDSLKYDEVPNYDRIHYLLQIAYWKGCLAWNEEHKDKVKSLKYQEKDEYMAEYAEKEKEVASFQRFTRGLVEQPETLTFFSSIIYDEHEKYFKNIEYCGVSLNLCYKPAKPNQLVFQCRRCINSKPCGLKVCVYYEGTEKTWEEARIITIEGDPKKCQKLNKINGAYKLFIEGMKPNGK